MQIYKRSIWGMLKGLIAAPVTTVLVFFVLNYFSNSVLLVLGIPALILVILLYITLFSERIRFELEESGELRYYKNGRLKEQLFLPDCQAGYYRKSNSGEHDISLKLLNQTTGREIGIDCSPLGLRRFEELYAQIKSATTEEPEVLQATLSTTN